MKKKVSKCRAEKALYEILKNETQIHDGLEAANDDLISSNTNDEE